MMLRLILPLLLLFSAVSLQAEKQQYTIKWGIILPLSGALAPTGLDIQRGIQMALSESKNKNIQHQLIFEDSRLESKKALSAAQKLINIDDVDILVALWDTADVVAPLAEKHNKVHASIRWNHNIALNNSNTFTFESTYEDYSKKTVEMLQKLDIKTASIISMESVGWELGINAIKKDAAEAGIKILDDLKYLTGENDFKLYAIKLLQKNPEIIFIFENSASMDQITKRIRALKPEQKISGYLAHNVDLSLYEDSYYVDQMIQTPEFEAKFKAKYGEPIYIRAHLAYDMASIIDQALSSFESKPNTTEIVKAMRQISSFDGASGPLKATHKGKVFQTECIVRKIENGQRINVDFNSN